MSINADVLLDRIQLKQKLRKWQIITALIAIAAVSALGYAISGAGQTNDKGEVNVGETSKDYIARINVDGVIASDLYRDKVLRKLVKDKHAKALILAIDSPGGTTGGSEELYDQIREISAAGKPVAVTMKTLAASGGYMTALGGDRIWAYNGTITGSIGVLMESPEFTGLAEKLGVTFNTVKSSELKASPSPFEKMTPKAKDAIQGLINSFYGVFVDMVAERRHLPHDKALALADGRVYTGTQAAANGLIDEIGGEKEALAWLHKDKKIAANLKVEDVSTKEPDKSLKDMLLGNDSEESKIFGKMDELTTSGLLAIYRN